MNLYENQRWNDSESNFKIFIIPVYIRNYKILMYCPFLYYVMLFLFVIMTNTQSSFKCECFFNNYLCFQIVTMPSSYKDFYRKERKHVDSLHLTFLHIDDSYCRTKTTLIIPNFGYIYLELEIMDTMDKTKIIKKIQ